MPSKGWECPRCGQVNAPWKRTCDCNKKPVKEWDKDFGNPFPQINIPREAMRKCIKKCNQIIKGKELPGD